jgi:hypothetical protein
MPQTSIEPLEPRRLLTGLALLGTQVNFGTGDEPRAVAVGDLNGDNKPDLVVADSGDDNVDVLLNNGDGSFAGNGFFDVGSQPQAVALADFNGDHHLDIATANLDGSVSVLLGNGNGTFQAQQTYGAGLHPMDVIAAELTGDGHEDLIVANAGDNTVGVLLGNGNGTFAPEQTFAAGNYPISVTAAELTGDGNLDLIAADKTGQNVSILLGNGNGTFLPPQTFAAGVGPASVATADLNGDGHTDLVVADQSDDAVSVLFGNGDGTFQAPLKLATGSDPSAVAIADLNGQADIITANETDGDVSVLLGNGNGTFASQQTFGVGDNAQSVPISLAVADLNGDGQPDIVATAYNDDEASVLLSGGASINLAVSGVLECTGTSGPDTVQVSNQDGIVSCLINETLGMDFPDAMVSAVDIATGAGADTVSIGDGVPQTSVTAGKGADTIVGMNDDDMFAGGKGRDHISSMGASSIVIGGAGADYLSTGSESGDSLFGGGGGDVMINGAGSGNLVNGGVGLNFAQLNDNDTLTNIFEIYDPNPADAPQIQTAPAISTTVNSGVLQIFGASGDDSISVSLDGDGNILVNGANPVPESNYTALLVGGRAGDDTITVSSAIDLPTTLRGGAGNDSLTGAGDDNVLVGSYGNDTLQGNGGGTNLLVPGLRDTFTSAPTGDDLLIGGPPGSINFADFSHRTDNLFLSNDGLPDSGDTAMGEATTIMPSVQNIFAGTGQDTVVSTIAGSFLSAGFGQDSITSGGSNTTIVAGPVGAGSDTVVSTGSFNALYLMNQHADTYDGNVTTDILEIDNGLDVAG